MPFSLKMTVVWDVAQRSLVDRVRARVSPCGICGGQSGTGTGFSPSSSVSPVSIMPLWLSILIYHLADEQEARWWRRFRHRVSMNNLNRLVDIDRRFRGAYCLHHEVVFFFYYSSITSRFFY
jgi:hypothetical protein